ncbi:hypothetical protein PILCRDRAFT_618376 [Piloderma croceum F 1598]|uniref:Uncharacterized protein n=1 Tax=Piloderma croceum (strain F 1598) TaxID=765440 RepID=A0A0C3FCR7_PILCF|nr:hypothetical protein PILCRDRAFT_618376 [Piloderma croceum F 1598]
MKIAAPSEISNCQEYKGTLFFLGVNYILTSKYLRDVVAHRANLEIHQTRKGVASSFDGDIDQNISWLVNIWITQSASF